MSQTKGERLRAIRHIFSIFFRELYKTAVCHFSDEKLAREAVVHAFAGYYVKSKMKNTLEDIRKILFVELEMYCKSYRKMPAKTEQQKATLQALITACYSDEKISGDHFKTNNPKPKEVFRLVYMNAIPLIYTAFYLKMDNNEAKEHYDKAVEIMTFLLHGIGKKIK